MGGGGGGGRGATVGVGPLPPFAVTVCASLSTGGLRHEG